MDMNQDQHVLGALSATQPDAASRNTTQSDGGTSPQRMLVILQGHQQWARERKMSRSEAFGAAAGRLLALIDACASRAIGELTLKVFLEDLSPMPSVVRGELAHSFMRYLTAASQNMRRNNIRLRCEGAMGELDTLTRALVAHVAKRTELNTGMQLTFSIDPGVAAPQDARMPMAAPLAPQHVAAGHAAKGLPGIEPDFVIRTGGDLPPHRAMLWDTQKTSLYFTDLHWPEFGAPMLDTALEWFAATHRAVRFEPSIHSRAPTARH